MNRVKIELLTVVVELLTKQNHDLKEQLRQKNVAFNTQEEGQKGISAKRRNHGTVGGIDRAAIDCAR